MKEFILCLSFQGVSVHDHHMGSITSGRHGAGAVAQKDPILRARQRQLTKNDVDL